MSIPRALHALSPHAYAGELLRRARRDGSLSALTAATARVNYCFGMVPQQYPGTPRSARVAWHRQSGIAGFGNRAARKRLGPDDLQLQGGPVMSTVESEQ